MTPVCAASWRLRVNDWYFCGLPRSHPGECACDGKERPPAAIRFEDDKEAQEWIEAQRVRQAKVDAKKSEKSRDNS